MSRSYQKTIAFGKSKRGAQMRNKTRDDYAAEKALDEDMPIHKQHFRYELQTLQDFINYVENSCNINDGCNDMYDRRNYELLKQALAEGRSRESFAKSLYKKYRAK